MCKKIIWFIIILIFLIITFLVFYIPKTIRVKSSNGEAYRVSKGDVVSGIKIVDIKFNKIVVKHIDVLECKYYKKYEFWPDSQGGLILYEEPEVILVFEKY